MENISGAISAALENFEYVMVGKTKLTKTELQYWLIWILTVPYKEDKEKELI